MESKLLSTELKTMRLETKPVIGEPNEEPSVSIPLEKGEVVERMTLDEYAKRLAQELYRVKEIVQHVDINEIGARIEECKISMTMYRSLFEVLVAEQTKRLNTTTVTDLPIIKE